MAHKQISVNTSEIAQNVQYPSKLLEMPEGALVTIWEIAIFQSAFFKIIKQSPHLFLMNFIECLI